MVLILDGLVDLLPVPQLDAQLLRTRQISRLERLSKLLDRVLRLLCSATSPVAAEMLVRARSRGDVSTMEMGRTLVLCPDALDLLL